MRIYKLLFFCFLSSCTGPAQPTGLSHTLLKEKDSIEVYQVINSILADPLLKTSNLSSKYEMPFIFFEDLDSLEIVNCNYFSWLDLKYFGLQRKAYSDFEIEESAISDSNLIVADFQNQSDPPPHFSLSRPIFNVSKTACVVRKGYYCGAFCGFNGVYIYLKSGDRWHLARSLPRGVR